MVDSHARTLKPLKNCVILDTLAFADCRLPTDWKTGDTNPFLLYIGHRLASSAYSYPSLLALPTLLLAQHCVALCTGPHRLNSIPARIVFLKKNFSFDCEQRINMIHRNISYAKLFIKKFFWTFKDQKSGTPGETTLSSSYLTRLVSLVLFLLEIVSHFRDQSFWQKTSLCTKDFQFLILNLNIWRGWFRTVTVSL